MVTHGQFFALSDNNTRDREEKKAEGKGNKFLATETETARKKVYGKWEEGGKFCSERVWLQIFAIALFVRPSVRDRRREN